MTTSNESPTTSEDESSSEEESSFAIVKVPAHLADKVYAYLSELTEDEGEVNGLVMRMIGGTGTYHPTGPTLPPPPQTNYRGDQTTDIR